MKNIEKVGMIVCSIISLLSVNTANALNYEVTSNVSDLVQLRPQSDPWQKISQQIIGLSGMPTGAKFNSSPYSFLMAPGQAAKYLFSTEGGLILGVGSVENKIFVAVDRSSAGAVYKGLEMAASCCGQTFLYATDFFNGKVDMFNKSFQPLSSFKNSSIPSGYGPFNVKLINDLLYVTYAKQLGPQNQDAAPGEGNGFIDLFSTSGAFVKRLISGGYLNSPWGLSVAPPNFGEFSNTLLVGNFGDGTIQSYHPSTGKFLGYLTDANQVPLSIQGLWSLEFDAKGTLHFTTRSSNETGLILPLP